jgi:tetratricopeptide (TPR) repeat protein
MLSGLGEEVLVTGEAQLVVSALDVVAHHCVASGDRDQAERLLRELEAFPSTRDAWNYPSYLPEIVRIACSALDADFAERFTVGIPPSAMERAGVSLSMAEAELAEARERFEEAAELYTSAAEGFRIFSIPERAQALLGRGRCLLELGDPAAEAALRESRIVFASLEANRFLPEVDSLLERALRLSS